MQLLPFTTLPTWSNEKGKLFRYSGSVKDGTTIEYGSAFRNKASVSGAQYFDLLQHFSKQEVPIGASRDSRPHNSVGEWLVRVTGTAIASYVGPILIHERYAERVSGRQGFLRFF
jgi:hypothetical protein